MSKFKRISRAWGKLDIEDNTQEAKRNIHKNLVAALEASAPSLRATGRAEVPVDEGDLQRSVDTVVNYANLSLGLTAGGVGAKHAHLVEFGTVHSKPDPFMRRTIRKERPSVLARVKTALGKEQT